MAWQGIVRLNWNTNSCLSWAVERILSAFDDWKYFNLDTFSAYWQRYTPAALRSIIYNDYFVWWYCLPSQMRTICNINCYRFARAGACTRRICIYWRMERAIYVVGEIARIPLCERAWFPYNACGFVRACECVGVSARAKIKARIC